MLRSIAARGAACGLVIALVMARDARAQQAGKGAGVASWNDPRTLALVQRATARRAEQLADTALLDYHAEAHGYVTFLAQVGQGFPEPPKIVKADELALQVYWRAPNLSKQVIEGRRDTLLLPTDIQYHRDHLGIVQNNFPNIIRLGEGDEVRDAPHPLSPEGRFLYDYAISDSLRYSLPGRTIEVYEVKVRPKNDRLPGIVGAVYIDTAGAQVVRMAFDFTAASFLDKQLEDVSIVLENGLVEGRFWLPRHQEIEIRRTGTWMDYPVRGIIRGRWEIADYRINTGIPFTFFGGPEIVQAPPQQTAKYAWPTKNILDSLPPDVRAVTDADVKRVQAEARALVRGQALQRARNASLAARGATQLVRVDRVEGLALGLGATQRFGAGFDVRGYGRYGIADHAWKGQLSLGWQSGAGTELRVFALHDFRDVADAAERSGAVNSIAAQEFGSDDTDPYRVAGGGVQLGVRDVGGLDWTLRGDVVEPASLLVNATPVSGTYLPTLLVDTRRRWEAALHAEHPTTLAFLGTELRLAAELRGTGSIGSQLCAALGTVSTCSGSEQTLRGMLTADIERPVGNQRFVARTLVAAVGAHSASPGAGGYDVPAQELVYLGGPTTAPGYDFHRFVALVGASQRVEWQAPIPFPSIPLDRFGRTPADAKLAPFVTAVYARPFEQPVRLAANGVGPLPFAPLAAGVYPSVGLGVLTFFDLLRFDVARGLRGGRWTFSVDVSRDLWPVL